MSNLKRKLQWVSISCLSCLTSQLYASGLQVFNGIAYSNPAELPYLVKNSQVQIGDDIVLPTFVFKGTTNVPPPVLPDLAGPPVPQSPVVTDGTSTSNNPMNLFYGRVAKRYFTNLILAIDVTQPFAINVVYPSNSPVRYTGTQFKVDSYDVSPNFGFQFPGKFSNLSIGAGFDALGTTIYTQQHVASLPIVGRNPAFPPTPPPIILRQAMGAASDLVFNNVTSGWAYGWHAGAFYRVTLGTFLGFSYYSALKPKLKGPSTFTDYPSTETTTEVPLPASYHAKATKFFNEKWWATVIARYTKWDTLKSVTLSNTAGPASEVSSTFDWRNTWRFTFQSFVRPLEKLLVGASVSTDEAPTFGEFRGPMTPAGNAVNLGFTSEYSLSDNVAILFTYAHVFTSDTNIHKTNFSGTTSTGEGKVSANLFGLRLKIDF